MRPEHCRECGLAGRVQTAPCQCSLPQGDKSWGRRGKAPGIGFCVNQRLRLGELPSDLFFFPHQLHIDLIDRVAEAFGCAIVLGLDFLK